MRTIFLSTVLHVPMYMEVECNIEQKNDPQKA